MIYLLRCVGSGLNSPKKYFDFSGASFAPDLEKALRLLGETEDILSYEYYPHMRKYYRNRIKWSVENDN